MSRASKSGLLNVRVVCLALSLAAALLLAGRSDVLGRHGTLLELVSWLERTLFWVGLIFTAGFILDRVYGQRLHQGSPRAQDE